MQKTNKKFIFIDTNLYRKIFLSENLESEIFPVLEKLTDKEYGILMPQQVIDEINRNRFKEWNTNSKDQFTETLEKLLEKVSKDEVKKVPNAKRFITSIKKQIREIDKKNEKMEKNLTSPSGRSNKLIKKITDISTVISDSAKIMEATKLRAIKGNPPYDFGSPSEKNCDRYIWESILDYFLANDIKNPKLFIFTSNTKDWCVEKGDEHQINPFLSTEFKNKANGNLKWSNDLGDLPSITSKEKKKLQREERILREKDKKILVEKNIADKLRFSNSWDETDKIIKKSLPYIKNFNESIILDILKASLENNKYSSGPFNQVLNASTSKIFFRKLYDRSREIKLPLSYWKTFYASLDESLQERFYELRKDIEKSGIEFNLSEDLKFIHEDDIPF